MSIELLSVDIEAAIRKLTASQLSRSEMRAVEALRVMFRAGANELELWPRRDALLVRAPGAYVAAADVQLIHDVLSTKRPPKERYASLLELEEHGALIWLALATDSGFELETRGDGHGVLLDCGDGEPEIRSVDGAGGPRCVVRLRRRVSDDRERKLLEVHVRHSRKPVFFDGDDLRLSPPSISDPLSSRVAGPGFSGHVRVTVGEDYSSIRWVTYEVLQTERYSQLAGGIAHDAVIYSERQAEVRERAITAVRDARENTVAALQREFDAIEDPKLRNRVREVMFARAIERHDVAVLGQARLFDIAGGSAHSVAELRERARGGALEVASVESTRPRRDGLLLLDSQGRRLLTELLRLPIISVGPIGPATGWRHWRERWRALLRSCLDSVGTGWSQLVRGQAVADHALSKDEQRFRRTLERLCREGKFRVPELAPAQSLRVRVRFVPRGTLPLRTRKGRDPVLLVPRRNRTVQRVVRALRDDPSTLYPGLDLLFGGRDGWGSERRRWRRRWMRAG